MRSKIDTGLLVTLGENIRRERISQKMSQSQLAFEIGTTLRQIQRIEKGEYHAGILFYVNISGILNISLEELTQDKEA